jgi:hypothetical protein
VKAYLKKHSYRPGCTCCNINKGLFGFKPRHGSTGPQVKASKRAGKRQARQALKKLDKESEDE